MAAAAVARPAQALRQRRDNITRPPTTKRGNASMDAVESPAKKRKIDEPYVRDSEHILRKHSGKPPSLIIHLHPTHFRFDGQDGSFAYDSPMKFIINAMRKQIVPDDMLEELLNENVPFYDGCLIVEVHNHRQAAGSARSERENKRTDSVVNNKFSMHAYNEHITPSPMAPYPKMSAANHDLKEERLKEEMTAPDKFKKESDSEGPKISTIVLHPTQMTRHIELQLLAKTPLAALANGKKAVDGNTPSNAQPSTPTLAGPATPLSTTRGPLSQQQKMCIDEGNIYSFQAEMLVATESPLYLGPAKTPAEAEAVLELLSDPLHNAKPPSPKTRKRTTAEMAADDAKAAEEERRMLIMDDRIKPSARAGASTATNENQGAAASLSFSRFKTLDMVRHDQEEKERVKKEEEARAAIERKQNEEQVAQQQKTAAANRQRSQMEHVQQQRQAALMLQQQRAAQMAAQRQAQMSQDPHQQTNGMMPRPQQAGFQANAVSVAQSSPVVRQQTPMMNSSPMLQNNGFPMTQMSPQNAGSPARPTSAAMQNRNVNMARQASQQHGSQHNTPQLAQGTPNMAQAVPNRQLSQTPRLPPGSPAAGMQGTPNMPMATSHLNQVSGLTPDQMAMLQQRGMANVANLTPEQIQHLRRQSQLSQQAGLTPQQQQAQQLQLQQQFMRRRAQQMQMAQGSQAQQMLQQGTSQMGLPQTPHQGHPVPNSNMMNNMKMMHGDNGTMSPHPQGTQMSQLTPQNAQLAHTQQQQLQLRQQQQQLNLHRAQQHLQALAARYGGFAAIPPEEIQKLPAQYQSLARKNAGPMTQMQLRQAQAMRANRMQNGAAAATVNGNPSTLGEQVPGQPDPQYMQSLRNQAMFLARQQQRLQQQQQPQNGGAGAGTGNMNALAMNMNMGQNPGQGQNNVNGNGVGGGGDLTQLMANMQNALNRPGGGANGQG
nr:saga complex subunit spt20 [Quercus suber]